MFVGGVFLRHPIWPNWRCLSWTNPRVALTFDSGSWCGLRWASPHTCIWCLRSALVSNARPLADIWSIRDSAWCMWRGSPLDGLLMCARAQEVAALFLRGLLGAVPPIWFCYLFVFELPFTFCFPKSIVHFWLPNSIKSAACSLLLSWLPYHALEVDFDLVIAVAGRFVFVTFASRMRSEELGCWPVAATIAALLPYFVKERELIGGLGNWSNSKYSFTGSLLSGSFGSEIVFVHLRILGSCYPLFDYSHFGSLVSYYSQLRVHLAVIAQPAAAYGAGPEQTRVQNC